MKKQFALIAVNEADSVHELVSINTTELNDAGQIVIPYGEQPVNSLDTRTGARKQVVQKLDKAAADKIAANFASLLQRAKRLVFGEVPVYVGHPDVFPKEFTDQRAYGWVKGINATADSLVIDVDWNKLGQSLVTERTYRWPSPAWDLEETTTKAANGLPVVVPSRIFSIGMTNKPNWKNALAVNEINLPGNDAGKNKETEEMDKRLMYLLAWLGLNTDATEEQTKQAADAKTVAVNETVTVKDKAVKDLADERTAWATKKQGYEGTITELTGKLTAANSETSAARAARADYALSVAVNEGRITPAEKDGLKVKLVACNDDSAYMELDKLPPKVKTESVAANVAGRKAEATGGESGVQTIIVAVNAEMTKSGTDWDTAYQAVKKSQPALFTPKTQ
jgi:hypothetical protein